MRTAHILIIADTTEAAEHLGRSLLPQAGHEVTLAEDFTPPPPCDLAVVDVTYVRGSALAGLQAQRRMGCTAPAILLAYRLTEQMAADMFALGIRAFVPRPIDDQALLERINRFAASILQERSETGLRQTLAETQDRLARRLSEMNALSHIGRAIATVPDIDTMLARIVEAAVFLARADEGAVFLLDEQSGELVLRAQQGFDAERASIVTRPSQDSDAMEVLQTGQPVIKRSTTGRKVATGYFAQALINVPIVIQRSSVGVLAVYSHAEHSFDEADQAVLSTLADYAAIALDKVRTLAGQKARISRALEAAQLARHHTNTLRDPAEGIDAQADTLLAGDSGSLSEEQLGAVTRIKLAAGRITETAGLIDQAIASLETELSD